MSEDLKAKAAQAVINEAQQEVAKEQADKQKSKLKDLYKSMEKAKVVMANIQREIDDAEAAVREGNDII